MPPEASALLSILAEQVFSLLAVLCLLGLSGFFSGSETALFSLTGYERLQMRQSSARLGHLVDRLLRDPQDLLMTILFANMAVNVSIFAISSVVILRLGREGHEVAAGTVGMITLLAVVLFGEILPKAVAYHLRSSFSVLVALPLWVVSRLIRPAMMGIRYLIITPVVRVLTGPGTEQQLQKDELVKLLDAFVQEELVQPDQVELLKNVIDLKELRVRQIMQPRVELEYFRLDGPVDELTALVGAKHSPIVLIYRDNLENIVGMVSSRRLYLGGPKAVADVVEPVNFVPEQQRVDQLVHFFRETNTNTAAVCDEYGGLAGLVRMEDVIEELLGKVASEGPFVTGPELQEISPGRYLADGGFEVADFCEKFKVPFPRVSVETLAGLVMNILGRLPQVGESVEYHGLILETTEIEQRRIKKITIVDHRLESQ